MALQKEGGRANDFALLMGRDRTQRPAEIAPAALPHFDYDQSIGLWAH